jgi:inosine/xanthosine triphosphate pyrophosphatase family protein
LEIKDWDNNPGPYIKYFPNHILPVGSLATFVICIAVIKVQSKVECFTFKTSGKICKELHGKNTFGFDSVFEIENINFIDPKKHPRYIAIETFLTNLNK